MADTKISGLSDGAPAQSADIFIIDRSGSNFRITAANLATLGGANFSTLVGAASAAQVPDGVTNRNTARQSFQLTTTSTSLTSSNLNMPASFLGAGIAIGTTFVWRFTITKTAAGTGTLSLVIHMGTAGNATDAAVVTQAMSGAQTAAVDTMTVDVMLTVTTAGASGAASWSICPIHQAATAAGFGVATGTTGQFQGTITSQNYTTANLKFSLGVLSSAGGTQATVSIPLMQGQVLNLA